MIRLRVLLPALGCELVTAGLLDRLAGTSPLWSALLALPIALVLAVLLASPAAVEPTWSAPPQPPSPATCMDASTLASRLEDAVTDQSRFRTRVQPRLALLAVSALRRRPGLGDLVDLADPRAATALGPRWHALLTDPAARMPDPNVLSDLLTSLEEL
jgi:hypothetical protein